VEQDELMKVALWLRQMLGGGQGSRQDGGQGGGQGGGTGFFQSNPFMGGWGYNPMLAGGGGGGGGRGGSNYTPLPAYPDVNDMMKIPAMLAQTLGQALGPERAAQYAAKGAGWSNWYGPESQAKTAHLAPWAQTDVAWQNNLGNMNVAQIQGENKIAGLRDVLKLIDAKMKASGSSFNSPYNISTDYGAGVNFT